jgi:hypothetical protein
MTLLCDLILALVRSIQILHSHVADCQSLPRVVLVCYCTQQCVPVQQGYAVLLLDRHCRQPGLSRNIQQRPVCCNPTVVVHCCERTVSVVQSTETAKKLLTTVVDDSFCCCVSYDELSQVPQPEASSNRTV